MAQVGIGSGSILRDHGHSASGDGAQLNPETALNPQPKVDFGDGSDGDVTVPVVLVAARDMTFNNLIINAGAYFQPNGFVIKIKGKLSLVAGTSYIFGQGGGGGNGAAGVGGTAGGLPYYSGTRYIRTCLPTVGAKGADGGAAGVTVSVGGIAPDIDLINVPLLYEGRLWAGAGGGGGGSIGDGVEVGAAPARVLAGAKGGDGADAQYIGPGNFSKGGGGGGAGGGKIEIWANEIDNNGVIQASGGDGGIGEGDADAQAGGGGGGAILIFYKKVSGGGLGTRTVSGGAGGASFGGVANGLPGAPGFSYAMKIGV